MRRAARKTLKKDKAVVAFDGIFNALKSVIGQVPDNYLVLDIETSGRNPSVHSVLQIAHCLVVDRKVVDRGSFFLDWSKGREKSGLTDAQLELIKDDIARVKKAFEDQNKPFHTEWQTLLKDGRDPVEVLTEYANWVEELNKEGLFMVMHNGYNFDCKFLTEAFNRYARRGELPCSDKHWFPDNAVFDTGVILKGAQIGAAPYHGETLRSFSTRVCSKAIKGVFWSLNEYAVPHFKLAEKHNLGLEKAHDAGYDTYVCHLLFEELRGRAEAASIPLLTKAV